MNIYIINLATAHDRAAFQEKQFLKLGLNFETVNAVTIADVSESYYKGVAFDWERPLSRAEVSCYLSHQSLWLRIISEDTPALILEDDAYVCDDLPELLTEIASFSSNDEKTDYINLETRCRKKIVSKEIAGEFLGYKLRRLYYGGTGAAAYILWPDGARKLLAMELKFGFALADAHLCRTKMNNSLQMDGAPVIQLDCCDHYAMASPHKTTSTIINTRHQVEMIKPPKTNFKFRRLAAQFKLGLIQLKIVFGRVTRKEIMPANKRFS